MENNNQAADQALRQTYIKAAIPQGFQFNPAFSEEDRQLLTTHYVESELEKMGGKLVIQNGQARIVQRDHQDLDLYDAMQTKVTLDTLVPKVVATRLGAKRSTTQDVPAGYGSSYQPSAEGLKEDQYIQNGITYTKFNGIDYPSRDDIYQRTVHDSINGKLSFHQAAKARIAQLSKQSQS